MRRLKCYNQVKAWSSIEKPAEPDLACEVSTWSVWLGTN